MSSPAAITSTPKTLKEEGVEVHGRVHGKVVRSEAIEQFASRDFAAFAQLMKPCPDSPHNIMILQEALREKAQTDIITEAFTECCRSQENFDMAKDHSMASARKHERFALEIQCRARRPLGKRKRCCHKEQGNGAASVPLRAPRRQFRLRAGWRTPLKALYLKRTTLSATRWCPRMAGTRSPTREAWWHLQSDAVGRFAGYAPDGLADPIKHRRTQKTCSTVEGSEVQFQQFNELPVFREDHRRSERRDRAAPFRRELQG